MAKAVYFSVTAAVVWFACVAAASGQDARVALAQRAAAAAARSDAASRLAARVGALKVSDAATVETLSGQGPDMALGLGLFLQDQVDAATPIHAPDATCRVSITLSMDKLAAKLRQLQSAPATRPGEGADAATMARLNGAPAVTVEGLGRTNEALIPPPLLATPAGATNASIAQASGEVRNFWSANATLRGQKLAELTAARRAHERLAALLEDIPLRGDLRVRDGLGPIGGPMRTELANFVKAVPESGRRYHPDVLLVEVEVSVSVDSFYQALLSWAKLHGANRQFQRAAEEAIRDRQGQTLIAGGMASVPGKHLAGQASSSLRRVTQFAGDLPDWVGQTRKGVGLAPAGNDPKLVLAAAGRDAAAKLNDAVLALPVPGGKATVRDLAAGDKEFLGTVTALCQVALPVPGLKPFGVDGSARVTVSLDLEPIWRMVLRHNLKHTPEPDWNTVAP